ncbi:SusC/RagA family TonB-linked outer membrane protein [Paludibacter sp. 221]|uniref:SusC/RagA family TonB-linked outer membrane protein n=1 Tax=Paludibacter sp. 221 TaxID=2302939 RepID=UPI0013D1F781|nr:SusC/RagA family TonB-linked outer membrane protein [Paludibacter sp. 221]NDV47395.1 SusC/RagA family TonB-linked outer membrane protein [Paludibacter sp. 221]
MTKNSKINHEKYKKSFFMKVVKLNVLFVVLSLFCNVSAAKTFSQSASVTLKSTNTSIKELFSEIEEQTNYSIFYERGIVDNKNVSIDAEDLSVEALLDQVLPAIGLKYHVNGNQIVVVEDTKSSAPASSTQASEAYTLRGTIVDNAGESLIGANVMIKGTTEGVITDFDGKFSIRVSRGLTLSIKYLGYKDEEVLITNQQDIRVVMYEDATQLQDVVVVGYGTQKKESVVGSVQTVRPTELQVPQSRLSNSFAGRLAGVVAVQKSGQPGANDTDFWIRGISTFSGVTSPLIILDGVEISSSDLNNLDTEVIESFSILKDATATALYGTRGANGVMIVTTKTGADLDKPVINMRAEMGITTPTNRPKTVDGATYMKMYNEAIMGRNPDVNKLYSENKITGTQNGWDPLLYPNVDWYEEMFKNFAMQEKFVFNIRGGSKKLDYFMNVSINHESGMIKGRSQEFYSFDNNINLMRYNFQNNIKINVSPTTIVALRINTQLYDYTGPSTNVESIFQNVMNSNPVDFPIAYSRTDTRNKTEIPYNGVLWGGKDGGRQGGGGYPNPMAIMTSGYKNLFESTVIANLDVEQKLDFVTKGLSFKALASFKNWTSSSSTRSTAYNQYVISDYAFDDQSKLLTEYNLMLQGNDKNPRLGQSGSTTGDRRIYLQAMLDYNRTFADVHNVSAMALYSQDEYNTNLPSTLFNSLPKRKQGIAGRLTYSYDYKYLAEVNFGYNGSENFAEGERWGFFPSFALGYNISQEKFWEPIKHVVSNLKLRGSWGLVGNDQIGGTRFVYLSEINIDGSSKTNYTTGRDLGESMTGPEYKRYENAKLTWEIGEKINAGIDLQLFNSINIMFDVFKENRRDIFLKRGTIPNYMGTADIIVYGNLGKVENKGFDLSLDYNKSITKDFFFSFKGTFTYAANKIVDRDEPPYEGYPNKSQVGHSINQKQMYLHERLFIDDEDVLNSPDQTPIATGFEAQAGDIKYKDIVNELTGVGDNRINDNDMVYYGYPIDVPEVVYGFGPSMTWKSWDFSFFFQGTARVGLMMSEFHPFGTSENKNVLQFIADDYWSEQNQNPFAAYPRLTQVDNPNNNQSSTYWYRDASFLKLKNLELGYSYKGLRVYLSGANLLTFSPFKHWDPEQGGGSGLKYPTQRLFSLGVQLNIK